VPFNARLFLFGFLPIVLLGVLAIEFATRRIDPSGARFGQRLQNAFLLAASLLFYAWGEDKHVLWMLLSIGGNFVLGRRIGGERARGGDGRLTLAFGVALNLCLLGWFKYANFFLGPFVDGWVQVALPIGISFYTFQALSFLVDVQRGQAKPPDSPIDFALYIALFPQLIAGPIVRYADLAAELAERRIRLDLFASGVRRFAIGLSKKVLIADMAARTADQAFGLPAEQLSPGLAWAGTIAYSVQIYFDFSGYSDMAIGLGRMLGMRFRENFDWPYISRSITEYWRRWHLSLSTWFRDYLYIPLGGNRRGALRTYLNLAAIFLLCGLWHGAAWTYVLWGGFQGLFLILERLFVGRWLERLWRPLAHVYMHLVLLLGWVLFRSADLEQAGHYYRALVGLSAPVEAVYREGWYIGERFWISLALGALCSLPWVQLWWRLERQARAARPGLHAALGLVGNLAALGLLALALARAAAQTQSPFIYFRF
jgi:alginate O-acetyltransferase complex protein AlgI